MAGLTASILSKKLAAGAKLINKPSQGGRSSSDYIMIVDEVTH